VPTEGFPRPFAAGQSLRETVRITKIVAGGGQTVSVYFSHSVTPHLVIEPSFEIWSGGGYLNELQPLYAPFPNKVVYISGYDHNPGQPWRWTRRPVSLSTAPHEFGLPQAGTTLLS
jgi:hypothetical protein